MFYASIFIPPAFVFLRLMAFIYANIINICWILVCDSCKDCKLLFFLSPVLSTMCHLCFISLLFLVLDVAVCNYNVFVACSTKGLGKCHENSNWRAFSVPPNWYWKRYWEHELHNIKINISYIHIVGVADMFGKSTNLFQRDWLMRYYLLLQTIMQLVWIILPKKW